MPNKPDYEEAPRFEKIKRKSPIPAAKSCKGSPVRWQRKRTDWSKTRNRHDHDLGA